MKKGIIVGNFKKKKQVDHIPNAWPYKEQLLKDIEAAKERMELVRLRKAEKKSVQKSDTIKEKLLAAHHQPVEIDMDRNAEDDRIAAAEVGARHQTAMGQNSRRAYLGELRKVVENADVILHVLDARDPLGTKSSSIEEMVLSHFRKKIVYVLNKADLVPREVLCGWLAFLRRTAPAVPFKSNTQSQKGNLGRSAGKVEKSTGTGLLTNQAVGADELIGLLKNYARSGDTKTSISVGIVGFPNVGKSSLINSLLRSRAVGVSSMPGFTKAMQEVVLDKNIRLLDSPGIVFADGDTAATVLRNCVNVDEVEDVLTPVQAILEKCPQAYIMQLYSIPRFPEGDVTAFLSLVARGTGKLKKGGIPNIDAAARGILHDWNSGKIKFYCKAPKVAFGGGLGEADTMVLSQFSRELDIKKMLEDEKKILDIIEAAEEEENEEFVSMDMVSGNSLEGSSSGVFVHGSSDVGDSMDTDQIDDKSILAGGAISGRKVQKKIKKKAAKDIRRGKQLEELEDYDFDMDFTA